MTTKEFIVREALKADVPYIEHTKQDSYKIVVLLKTNQNLNAYQQIFVKRKI